MKFILIIVLILTSVSIIYSQKKAINVTYIANCGFLVEYGHKQILIDVLINSGYNSYLIPTDSTVTKILNGQEPFNRSNVLLVTHNHPDHFDAQKAIKCLNNNLNNTIIAPSLVVNSIRNQNNIKISDRQIIEMPEMNQQGFDTVICGIRIKSYFLLHDNRPEIQNVGYVIEIDDIKIFHSGDNTGSNTSEFEFMQLQNKSIDVALLNYYGFWNSIEERNFTKSHINPKNIELMHIPPKEIENVKDSCNKITDFLDITIFLNSMERKSFTCNNAKQAINIELYFITNVYDQI